MKYQFDLTVSSEEESSSGQFLELAALTKPVDFPNQILRGDSVFFYRPKNQLECNASNILHYPGGIFIPGAGGKYSEPCSRVHVNAKLLRREDLSNLAYAIIRATSEEERSNVLTEREKESIPWTTLWEAKLFLKGSEGNVESYLELYPQFGKSSIEKMSLIRDHEDAFELLKKSHYMINPVIFPLVIDLVKDCILYVEGQYEE